MYERISTTNTPKNWTNCPKTRKLRNNNQQLIRTKEELEAKVNYLEKREQELKDQLENQQIELSEKSELIDKATSKIEDLLGSIDIDA